MINYITYAGKSLMDFKLYVNGRGTYNAPGKNYTMVQIPGRSGDLAYDDKKYENVDVTYPACWIYPPFEENYYDLRAYLYSFSGYQRLEDTYHPNEYRMAIFKEDLEIKNMDMLNMFGTFDLVFHCKPQRFLKSGDLPIIFSASGSINNPTLFESKPLIHVYGYGTLGIGSQSIVISNPGVTDFYIDCELMEAYKIVSGSRVSVDSYIQLSSYVFPTLKAGNNGISLSGNITSVEITPRWWTI